MVLAHPKLVKPQALGILDELKVSFESQGWILVVRVGRHHEKSELHGLPPGSTLGTRRTYPVGHCQSRPPPQARRLQDARETPGWANHSLPLWNNGVRKPANCRPPNLLENLRRVYIIEVAGLAAPNQRITVSANDNGMVIA